ncbi:MAG: hypothetical protein WBG66_17560 [Geitlerinemataceae cyanobacterium]
MRLSIAIDSTSIPVFVRRTIATVAATAGGLTLMVPLSSVSATEIPVSQLDYESCAGNLLNSGISADLVAASCGSMFRPQELGSCVADIEQNTPVAAIDALSNCRQVRRPLELATCVVNIHSMTNDPAIGEVLDRCRRSLLPERFANCVVGVSNPLDAPKFQIPPSEAMNACIDAPDRIGDIFPTYIPQNEPFGDRPNLRSSDR